jgi:hypothetical protein
MDTSNLLLCSITSDLNDLTTLIPNTLLTSFKTFITHMSIAAYIIKYIEQDLPVKISSFLAYLFIPFIGSIVLSLHSFTHWILTISIYSDTSLASRW